MHSSVDTPDPVFRFARLAAGTADTDELRVRKAMLIPSSLAHTFLQASPSGRLSMLAFYHLLVPELDSGDADRVATVEPLFNWYRVSCMATGAGADHSPLEITPTTSALPLVNLALQDHATRIRDQQLARLGVGGPALSSAAFQAGVAQLNQTMTVHYLAHF